jgi:hypothetical protein
MINPSTIDPLTLPSVPVADRTEDEGAAQAAGVSFMWADKWLQKEKN